MCGMLFHVEIVTFLFAAIVGLCSELKHHLNLFNLVSISQIKTFSFIVESQSYVLFLSKAVIWATILDARASQVLVSILVS